MFSIKKEYQISFLFLFKWLISPSSSHIRCLKWGYLLLQRINMEVGIPLVSMPYIGLLPSGPSPNCRRIYLCQCPTSGFSHFYGEEARESHLRLHVSMPYIGLLPFLRYPSKTNDFPACSNPKFAYVFEKGRFFILFRLIFGFLKIFTILFSIL